MKIGAMEVQRYQCRVSEVIYSNVMKIGAMEVQRCQCMTRINMKLKERYIYIYIYIYIIHKNFWVTITINS